MRKNNRIQRRRVLLIILSALALITSGAFTTASAFDFGQGTGGHQTEKLQAAELQDTKSQLRELQNITVDTDGVMTWNPDPEAKCYQVFYGDGRSMNSDYFFSECRFHLKKWLDDELVYGNIESSPAHVVQIIAFNRDLIHEGQKGFYSVEDIPADMICARGLTSYSYKELDRCKNVNIDKNGILTWEIDGKYGAQFGYIRVDDGEPRKVFDFSVDLNAIIDEEAARGRVSGQQHEISINLFHRSYYDDSGDDYDDIWVSHWSGTYDYLSPYTGLEMGTVKNVRINSDQQVSWDAYPGAASYDITVSISKKSISHTEKTKKSRKNKIKIPWDESLAWNAKTIRIEIKITARDKNGITIAESKTVPHKYKKKTVSTIRIVSDISSIPEKGKKIRSPKFADKSGVFGFDSIGGSWWKKTGNKWVLKDSGTFTTGEWKYFGRMEAYRSDGWIYNVLKSDADLYAGGIKCKHEAMKAGLTEGPDYDFYLELAFESPVFRIGSAPKTSIKKLIGRSRGFQMTWKKKSKAAGYQVRYSTKRDFSDYVYTRSYKKKVSSARIGKLKKGKRYYVQIRTYKLKKGKEYYSPWSARKTVKTR